jgi:hypothetical protein
VRVSLTVHFGEGSGVNRLGERGEAREVASLSDSPGSIRFYEAPDDFRVVPRRCRFA